MLDSEFENVAHQSATPGTTSVLYNRRFSPVTTARTTASINCTTKVHLILPVFMLTLLYIRTPGMCSNSKPDLEMTFDSFLSGISHLADRRGSFQPLRDLAR